MGRHGVNSDDCSGTRELKNKNSAEQFLRGDFFKTEEFLHRCVCTRKFMLRTETFHTQNHLPTKIMEKIRAEMFTRKTFIHRFLSMNIFAPLLDTDTHTGAHRGILHRGDFILHSQIG